MISRILRAIRYKPDLRQIRNLRPSVEICKDKFQVKLDMHGMKQEEIKVRVSPEYLVVEGKKELKHETGYFIKQIYRKFKLPRGCDPQSVESKITSEGILTITAKRSDCSDAVLCERFIPVDLDNSKEDKNLCTSPPSDPLQKV